MTPSSSSSLGPGPGEDRYGRPLRSKGLLPAITVGGVVYIVTGFASLSTLGLVAIGAGVGYGVGSWIADKFGKKDGIQASDGARMDQLPWAVQVALQQWQDFLSQRTNGRQLQPADVEQIWAEFEQVQPTHAMNCHMLIRGASAVSAGQTPVVASGAPGMTYVASKAAEV